jgi:hypothetical protein
MEGSEVNLEHSSRHGIGCRYAEEVAPSLHHKKKGIAIRRRGTPNQDSSIPELTGEGR